MVNITETHGLDVALDLALDGEIERLGEILSGADDGSADGDAVEDDVEDGQAHGTWGKTDADDGAVAADVVHGIREGLGRHSDDQDTVGTKSARQALHLGDHVLLEEVDEVVGTQARHKAAFVGAAVDTDDNHAHGLGVLNGQMAQATASSNDSNNLTRPDLGLLQTFVDSDTGAKDRCSLFERQTIGDPCDMGSLSEGVLLERAVDGVSRVLLLEAEGLVTLEAVLAGTASGVQPNDADTVADLEILNILAEFDDVAGAFMPTN